MDNTHVEVVQEVIRYVSATSTRQHHAHQDSAHHQSGWLAKQCVCKYHPTPLQCSKHYTMLQYTPNNMLARRWPTLHNKHDWTVWRRVTHNKSTPSNVQSCPFSSNPRPCRHLAVCKACCIGCILQRAQLYCNVFHERRACVCIQCRVACPLEHLLHERCGKHHWVHKGRRIGGS